MHEQVEKNENSSTRASRPSAEDVTSSTGARTNRSIPEVNRGSNQKTAGNTRKAGGPQTDEGKRRIRFNAVKSGIFLSRLSYLPHESPAEHKLLLDGYREYFQPQGIPEEILVEELATNRWRKRRLLSAESAESVKSYWFESLDLADRRRIEAWDVLRAGASKGGTLRHSGNNIVLRNALDVLETIRGLLAEKGFKGEQAAGRLKQLYGIDPDGAAPWGLFHMFVFISKVINQDLIGTEHSATANELKGVMLELFDKEIERLKSLESKQRMLDGMKVELESAAAAVPPAEKMELFIRYEAHLTREHKRILADLMDLQRRRLDQPLLPPIKVDVTN